MSANEMIVRINEIQKMAYNGFLTKSIRNEWKELCRKIREAGFRLSKHRTGFGVVEWRLKDLADVIEKRDNRFVCEWVNKDMSPDHKHLKGNCTTRSFAFCLLGKMTYDEIEAEQYRIGAMRHTIRNARSVTREFASNLGYVSLYLVHTIRRDKLALRLSVIENPMMTASSGHLAVINKGTVVDSWDSRGGRVKEILVKKEDEDRVRNLLGYALRA